MQPTKRRTFARQLSSKCQHVIVIVIVIVIVVVVVVDAAVVVAAVLFALLLLHPRCCFPLFIPHAHTVYYTAMKCESMGGP